MSQRHVPSRPLRVRLVSIAVWAAVALSACGAPAGAAPSPAQPAPTAPAAQADQLPPLAAPPTPAAAPPPMQAAPAAAQSPAQTAPTPVPACSFAGAAGPEPQVPALDAYTFSEPKVVLTGQSIGIAGWLPDSRRVLITRADFTLQKQAIEIFDVQDGATQRFAIREGFGASPIWLEAQQAVAFADVDSQKQIVLRLSRGPATAVEEVALGLDTPYLTTSPKEQHVLFFSKAAYNQPQVVGTDRGPKYIRPLTPPLASQTLAQGEGRPVAVPDVATKPLWAAWRPTGDQVALYNQTGFYLANATTGQVCMIDVGTHPDGRLWASSTRWSPDGRYLAMLTTVGNGLPFPFQYLTLLDTATGQQRKVDLGGPFIFEVAWGPNSRQILALGRVGQSEERRSLLGLHMIDAPTGAFKRLLPDRTFTPGDYTYEGGGLAWSSDGQKALTRCPVFTETPPIRMVEDRVCMITVTTQP